MGNAEKLSFSAFSSLERSVFTGLAGAKVAPTSLIGCACAYVCLKLRLSGDWVCRVLRAWFLKASKEFRIKWTGSSKAALQISENPADTRSAPQNITGWRSLSVM